MKYISIFKNLRSIFIPDKLMKRFIKRALSTDIEVGGMLIGKIYEDKAVVRELVIGKNILKSPIRFELDINSISEALIKMKDDEDIIAIIHSHPAGPYPSHVDRENMKSWPVIWIIIDSRNGDYKAWFFDKEIEIVTG